jgi:hypothetical protein
MSVITDFCKTEVKILFLLSGSRQNLQSLLRLPPPPETDQDMGVGAKITIKNIRSKRFHKPGCCIPRYVKDFQSQKKKVKRRVFYDIPHFARSRCHLSSVIRWTSSSTFLPCGLNRCLKRPCPFKYSATGFFFCGASATNLLGVDSWH